MREGHDHWKKEFHLGNKSVGMGWVQKEANQWEETMPEWDFGWRSHLIYPGLVDDVLGIGCISQRAHGLTVASVCRRHSWGRKRKLKTPPSPPTQPTTTCLATRRDPWWNGWLWPFLWGRVPAPTQNELQYPTHWQPWWFWSCLQGCPLAARSTQSPGMGCKTAFGRVPLHCWSQKES